jgi:hypothetical protein
MNDKDDNPTADEEKESQPSNEKVLTAVCLGVVGVDSGHVLITDPCTASRIKYPEEGPNFQEEWDAMVDERLQTMVQTMIGDGYYPVFGLLNDDGKTAGVYIDFDWAENRKEVTVILDHHADDDDERVQTVKKWMDSKAATVTSHYGDDGEGERLQDAVRTLDSYVDDEARTDKR